MSATLHAGGDPDPDQRTPRRGGFARLAEGVGLAAAPTFAGMAMLTHLFEQGPMTAMCGASGFPLGGMVPMYLLMSGFHLGPWLRRAGRRAVARSGRR